MDRLVELSLDDVGIDVFPSSIGDHCTSLTSLRLVACEHLESIEGNFHALKCLKKLEFDGLPKLKKLPEISLFDEKCCLEKLRSSIRGWCFYGFQHMRHCLRNLDVSLSKLKDGEIPSDISELSDSQVLNLSYNDFSRLHFSLSQLTRLKLLNLSGCKYLVELPDLPSNILWGCPVTGANKILGSMLQGYVENYSFNLRVDGIEIPKTFIHLVSGQRYTLQLQPNWLNDYSGFLMCATLRDKYFYGPLDITMEHGIGIIGDHKDCFDYNDVATWVGYVSFASLRQTTWWELISDTVSFSIKPFPDIQCTGFVVGLVRMNRGSGLMETTQIATNPIEYDDDYRHKVTITHDSKSTLKIDFPTYNYVR